MQLSTLPLPLIVLLASIPHAHTATAPPRFDPPLNPSPSSTTRHNIKWLSPNRSLSIRLSTPDLPLWNSTEHIGISLPTSFILSITLSPDNGTLLVQGEPFLPLQNSYVPPRLWAPQSGVSEEVFMSKEWNDERGELWNAPRFGLDYTRVVRPRDDWGRGYRDYSPTITLDVIGAGIEGHDALLPSSSQYLVMIKLQNWNIIDFPSSSSSQPKFNFTIQDVWLQKRDGGYSFLDVDNLKECRWWKSWRCEDVKGEPWYINILRRDFDEFGKIGCARRVVVKGWSEMKAFLRWKWMAGLLIVAVVGTVGAMLRESIDEVVEKVIEHAGGFWKRRGWVRREQRSDDIEIEAVQLLVDEGTDIEEDDEEVEEEIKQEMSLVASTPANGGNSKSNVENSVA